MECGYWIGPQFANLGISLAVKIMSTVEKLVKAEFNWELVIRS